MAPWETDATASEREIDHGAIEVELERTIEALAVGFPIVGVGSSAGGLAAFEAFFSGMPADIESGMAFVLVQHLAPDHGSMLAALVRRYTRMQVFEAEDGMRLEQNSAYIIPPNRHLTLLNGSLQLAAQTVSRGLRLPVDFFFHSLAREQRDRAVGIVLSGAGTDGTLGARAIKGEGGIVMAQTPESTEYDGMPRSVIATGLVDHVLSPNEMPAQLMAYAGSLCGRGRRPSVPPPPQMQPELDKIVAVLRAHTGHDFSQYKKNTIRRRVERRMAVQHIEQLAHYGRYLEGAPAEAQELLRDLLIGVTSFFRDPKAFAALETLVIPQLVDSWSSGSSIRAWVPGCSTGEEAYSIAILLHEAARIDCPIQIFGTDIDPRAIEIARAGVYPASIASDITPARLAHYFSLTDDGKYCAHECIRDLLIFSEQDVVRDPPFSRLDLISCRNLMIYMGAELQQKLIPIFHYALSPGGSLFLGTSETVGDFLGLFATTDGQAKLYQRKSDVGGVARPSLGRGRATPVPWGRRPSSCPPRASELSNKRLGQGLDPSERAKAEEARFLALAHALRAKEESFHAAQEEMQTSNEEFRASIEELQSTNEQLQSTNEQLETSKEQIQSLNEQLTTLNAQLQSKMTDLSRVNDDMNSLLARTDIGTLVVDRETRIRRYTAAVTRFIPLVQTDIGRSLRHVTAKLAGHDRLVEDVQCVMDSLTPARMEAQTGAGTRYCWQVRPYRTCENVIEGAIISLTEMKSVEDTSVTFLESGGFGSVGSARKERGIAN